MIPARISSDAAFPAMRSPEAATRARILYSYGWSHMDTGSPRALVSVVESLQASRFDPVFLAGQEGPLVSLLRDRGAEIARGAAASVTFRRPWSALAAVRRQLLRLKSLRIDLLHLNEAGWNFDLVIAAALRRIPVVLHIHNPVSIERRNVDWLLADRVVFVSQAQLASTKRLNIIERKSSVIYNAIDLGRFARGASLRGALGLARDDFVVCIVSQISRRKGIDVLLDAAASLIPRHANLVFLIVGPPARDEEVFADEMRARAAERRFGGKVRFLGPRSDIPDVLASCDLFCHPARAEPLGMAVIEAMAAGLPVAASRVGGIPEIIHSPSVGSLVEPITGESFANAIEQIMARPDRGRAMGRAGSASLNGRFDPATMGAQWRDLYCGLLRDRRSRA